MATTLEQVSNEGKKKVEITLDLPLTAINRTTTPMLMSTLSDNF